MRHLGIMDLVVKGLVSDKVFGSRYQLLLFGWSKIFLAAEWTLPFFFKG